MSTDPRSVVTATAYDTCPVTSILHRIGDRWSPAIIRLLSERPHGFNEIDRAIEGISRRMLTRTLRALEDEGLVRRTAAVARSGRVLYSLTEAGTSLREHLATLGLWAAEHAAELHGTGAAGTEGRL